MSLKFNLYNAKKLYDIILDSSDTPDYIISKYYYKFKNIGSKDRSFISETIYTCLRLNTYLSKRYHKKFHIDISLYLLLRYKNLFIHSHSLNYKYLNKIDMEKLISISEFPAINFNSVYDNFIKDYNDTNMYLEFLPDIIIKHTDTDYNLLAKSLLKSSNSYIWINTSITQEENKILSEFTENNIAYSKSNLLPKSFLLHKRSNIRVTNAYKKGLIESQGDASQLASKVVNPKDEELILDVCAGAGGKSLHIASLNKSCTVVANDINSHRLKELPKRTKRLHLHNIKLSINNNLQNISLPFKKFDKILIDAPCSGSGTFSKNPLILHNFDIKSLNKIIELQSEILSSYSKYLKNNGVLIYATCSIFKKENQNIISEFLINNKNFTPYPLINSLNQNIYSKLNISETDFSINLFPHSHNTDGFFISTLQKIS